MVTAPTKSLSLFSVISFAAPGVIEVVPPMYEAALSVILPVVTKVKLPAVLTPDTPATVPKLIPSISVTLILAVVSAARSVKTLFCVRVTVPEPFSASPLAVMIAAWVTGPVELMVTLPVANDKAKSIDIPPFPAFNTKPPVPAFVTVALMSINPSAAVVKVRVLA